YACAYLSDYTRRHTTGSYIRPLPTITAPWPRMSHVACCTHCSTAEPNVYEPDRGCLAQRVPGKSADPATSAGSLLRARLRAYSLHLWQADQAQRTDISCCRGECHGCGSVRRAWSVPALPNEKTRDFPLLVLQPCQAVAIRQ